MPGESALSSAVTRANECPPKWNRPKPPDRNQSMRGREVDAKYHTHLAVNFGRNVERDLVKNYDHDGGPARNKVDLWEGQI
jgi:hypothetical protein